MPSVVLPSRALATAIRPFSRLLRIKWTKFPVGYASVLISQFLTYDKDVYNMQLSNEPAEELAKYLVSTGGGAFDLCGIVSGGWHIISVTLVPILKSIHRL